MIPAIDMLLDRLVFVAAPDRQGQRKGQNRAPRQSKTLEEQPERPPSTPTRATAGPAIAPSRSSFANMPQAPPAQQRK